MLTEAQVETILSDLRAIGTDQQDVEVKLGVGKSVRDTLSSFSNTSGGLLIVGLSESDNFAPVKGFDAQRARDQLFTMCDDLSPVVRPEVNIVTVGESQLLVARISEVAPKLKPVHIAGQGVYNGSFIRAGDGDRKMKPYEVDRLQEEKVQPLWDEDPVERAQESDLATDILEAFLEDQGMKRPRTFANGRREALQRLVVLKDDSPTLAALLVMGVDPQQFFPRLTVSFAVFPGTDRGAVGEGVRLLDSQTLYGPIPDLVDQTLGLVARNMRTAALVGSVFRRDLPDYPLVAVREALVNALMHRDYSPESRGAQVQVNMFIDRLEISNPGGLFGGVTVDSLGEPGVSQSRNQRLSAFLEVVRAENGGPIAENRGTGFAVIQSELAKNLMPEVVVKDKITEFKIIFYRRTIAPQESYMSAQQRVRRLFDAKVSVSTNEAIEETGLSRSAVQKALNELIDQGEVERTEPRRSPRQRYRVIR